MGNMHGQECVLLDLDKLGLPKILLSQEVRRASTSRSLTNSSSPYILQPVPNTCGFCDVMVEYSLLLVRYSLRL